MRTLFSQYKYKNELHAHTSPVSLCSQIPAKDMAGIYASLGYNTLSITNHFEPSALKRNKKEFLEYYINDYNIVRTEGEKLGLNVILGCEIRFTENINDYLVFGICEEDLSVMYDLLDKGIVNFYNEFKNERNVILQAHPFRDGMSLAPADSVDGVESFNMHPGHNSRLFFSSRYAAEHNMLATCGTDFHHPGHEGAAALLSKTEVHDSYELAALIKSRDYLFDIGGSLVLPYGDHQ